MTQRSPVPYNSAFYSGHAEGAARSANKVVPAIIDLTHCRSVIDVGCGLGCWLRAFVQRGVNDVLGIDGAYVNRDQLCIAQEHFSPADLRNPICLNRRFDVAISLEVAEHLPPECAATFVESLVRLSDIVVFSAAIPGQGGTQHLNEQWPCYWARLFAQHDFLVLDCFRRRFWNDADVEWWYAQNLLVFAASDAIARNHQLEAESKVSTSEALPFVHPCAFSNALQWSKTDSVPLRFLIRSLPHAAWRTTTSRLRRLAKFALSSCCRTAH